MTLSAPPVADSGPSSTLVVVTGAARTIGLPRVHRSLATHVIAALGGAPAVDQIAVPRPRNGPRLLRTWLRVATAALLPEQPAGTQN